MLSLTVGSWIDPRRWFLYARMRPALGGNPRLQAQSVNLNFCFAFDGHVQRERDADG
ncbi:hypothetical protein QF001_001567 [Paraburkholderia youngii]